MSADNINAPLPALAPLPAAANESVISKASADDLLSIRQLLSDQDIARLGQYMGENCLWNCAAFVDKVGFTRPDNAIRNARNKGLIICDLPLRKAVGLTEIDGLPIINPVPQETVVQPRERTMVRFMTTIGVLEWLSGAATEKAAAVRHALWWLYFSLNEEHVNSLRKQMTEQERVLAARDETILELGASIRQLDATVAQRDAVITHLNAALAELDDKTSAANTTPHTREDTTAAARDVTTVIRDAIDQDRARTAAVRADRENELHKIKKTVFMKPVPVRSSARGLIVPAPFPDAFQEDTLSDSSLDISAIPVAQRDCLKPGDTFTFFVHRQEKLFILVRRSKYCVRGRIRELTKAGLEPMKDIPYLSTAPRVWRRAFNLMMKTRMIRRCSYQKPSEEGCIYTYQVNPALPLDSVLRHLDCSPEEAHWLSCVIEGARPTTTITK